jgi:uncharacterized protein (DUF1800 family)
MQPDDSQRALLSRREFLQGAAMTAAVTTATAVGGKIPAPASAAEPTHDRLIQAVNIPDAQAVSKPPLAYIALTRMGFGPRPGDVSAFEALGATDEERLFAYIEQQLDPASLDDSEVESRLAASNVTTLDKSLPELWADHIKANPPWEIRTMPMRETERAAFVRAMYSKRQLVEVLADFWHNHFNVKGWEYMIAPVFVHYDRDVIRANLLGNFRDMLEAVAKSPAMLYYLDNESNTRSGPNENFARELFEIHALGAEHYLGVMDQFDVPQDGEGWPVGYVDEDVYEATRCLTGWTVNDDTGAFEYVDDNHDRFQKWVLGQRLKADQAPQKDGEDVLDLVAFHPGTARHVCRKLCIRFISDRPPESIVESATAVFRAQKDAPDQLKQVVRHILRSTEFQRIWGEKIKRPFEAIVSALRATNADWTIRYGDNDSNSFIWQYGNIGQPLYNWPAPDGYPDTAVAWQSTTSLILRWRMINWLVNRRDDDDNYYIDILSQTPSQVRSATYLTNFWCFRIFGYAIGGSTRTRLSQFMAQDSPLDEDLPLESSDQVFGRLRTLIALILQTPEFNLR